MAERFNVELADVPCVGDGLRDLQAAAAAGAKPYLVLTGKGEATQASGELPPGTHLAETELSASLGVSRGTVNNRLRKLEDSQVILGYTVRLRPEAEPERIRAWMGVLIEGNTTRQVIASLLGEPGVVALHDTNGRWDLLAEIEAASTRELSDVLERIRLIGGIRSTETNIHLASYR